MFAFVFIVSLIGVALCLYGISIEQEIRKNPLHKAACDISELISCTKTFTSPYAKLLGISNSWVGLIFYCGMLFLALFEMRTLLLIGSVFSLFGSVYLAYLQYFKIKTVCLLCTALYIVNVVLFIGSYYS